MTGTCCNYVRGNTILSHMLWVGIVILLNFLVCEQGCGWPVFAHSVIGISFLFWCRIRDWVCSLPEPLKSFQADDFVQFFYGLSFGTFLTILFYKNPEIDPSAASTVTQETAILIAFGFVCQQLAYNDLSGIMKKLDFVLGFLSLYTMTYTLILGTGANHVLSNLMIGSTCYVGSTALSICPPSRRNSPEYLAARILNMMFLSFQKYYMSMYIMLRKPSPQTISTMIV